MNPKAIGISLFILGVYSFLLTGIFDSSLLFTSKTEACRRIELRAKRENNNDINIESAYFEKRNEILTNTAIKLSIGVLLISFGLLLGKFNLEVNLLSGVLQAGYWILFSGTALYITTEGFINFITCDFTWLFIFLTAGLTGFYFGYIKLTMSSNTILRSILLILLFSGIGGVASYGSLIFHQIFTANSLKNVLGSFLPIGFFSFITFTSIFIGVAIKRVEQTIRNKTYA